MVARTEADLVSADTEIVYGDDLLGQVVEIDPELVLADGYNDCIIGVSNEFGRPMRVAYDRGKVIEKLAEQMPWDEAEEFFEFNIAGAYVGERTPAFIDVLVPSGLLRQLGSLVGKIDDLETKILRMLASMDIERDTGNAEGSEEAVG